MGLGVEAEDGDLRLVMRLAGERLSYRLAVDEA